MLRGSYDDDAVYSLNDLIERLCAVGPAARRRRRRRADEPVGARAALHDRQHALRGRPRGAAHDQPARRRAEGADRAIARSRA
jgi:hypothetical protein